MDDMLQYTIFGLLAGVLGTGLGGFLAMFIRKESTKVISALISISAGVMLAVVCFDLLPQAFQIGGIPLGLVGLLMGVAAVSALDYALRIFQKSKKKRIFNSTNTYLRMGVLLGLGIALHNLPEGLAIGSGWGVDSAYGIGLALLIGVHDIPEGLAMAVPLRAGGVSSWKTLLYTLLVGVPTGLGAFFGGALGGISGEAIALCLSAAGGAMLYIICDEMIPQTSKNTQNIFKLSTVFLAIGFCAGIFVAANL